MERPLGIFEMNSSESCHDSFDSFDSLLPEREKRCRPGMTGCEVEAGPPESATVSEDVGSECGIRWLWV